MFDLNALLRENIKKVKPYSSARDEYSGTEGVFLDANENPYGSVSGGHWNRYPDPLQHDLKERLAQLKRVKPEQIFLGNGSDEPIDLLIRALCVPGKDSIITVPPTYSMYEVSASINDVAVKEVHLDEQYQLRVKEVLSAVTPQTKIIFLCSPNNPTGTSLRAEDIDAVIKGFNGIVVIDEAYIDFAPYRGYTTRLDEFPNLVVLQTFSKAWGLAALRLGMAFASKEIIAVLNRIKSPYNVNAYSQEQGLLALKNLLKKEDMVADILAERDRLEQELGKMKNVVQFIYPSDANFLMVKTPDGDKVYNFLIKEKIITRNRSKVILCEGCIRITVGTAEENTLLINALAKYQ